MGGLHAVEERYGVMGRRIREARSKLGLTQEQLGERANLHYSYIGQVERGA
ncbi:MAG: helix-turn-helix transcriptional regulator, partial [Firmicutes bacterium]|nr:helix-turn-helix transcriptional regulator [Bacillota bacterium]